MYEFNSRLELKRESVKWKKGQNEIWKRNYKRHTRYFKMFGHVSLGAQKEMKQMRQEQSLKRKWLRIFQTDESCQITGNKNPYNSKQYTFKNLYVDTEW